MRIVFKKNAATEKDFAQAVFIDMSGEGLIQLALEAYVRYV